jgi:hypothetical protein
MESEAQEKIGEDSTWEQQDEYWKGFSKDIISMGGVVPYKGGIRGEEVTIIPNNLIRETGKEPDRIVEILSDYFPCYGVETELDFNNICEQYGNFQAANKLKRGQK